MKRTIEISEEAEADLIEAFSWYENQKIGLGQKFINQFERTVNRIADKPKLFPVKQRKKRRALMPVFPFAIYFQIEGSTIYILGVIHGKKHPKSWEER